MIVNLFISPDMILGFWIGMGSAAVVLGLAAIGGMIVDGRKAKS